MDNKRKGITLVAGIYLVSDQSWPHGGDATRHMNMKVPSRTRRTLIKVIQRILDDLRCGIIPDDVLTLPTAVDRALVLLRNHSGSRNCLEDQIAEHALGGDPCSSGPEISSMALYAKRVRVFAGISCESSCCLTPTHAAPVGRDGFPYTDILYCIVCIILYTSMPWMIDELITYRLWYDPRPQMA
jgi:hypothetical protein